MTPRTGEIKDSKKEVKLNYVLKDVQEFSKWTRMVEHTRWFVQTWKQEYEEHT